MTHDLKNVWRIGLIAQPTGEKMKMNDSMRKEWRSELRDRLKSERTKTNDLTSASRSKRKNGSFEGTSRSALLTKSR